MKYLRKFNEGYDDSFDEVLNNYINTNDYFAPLRDIGLNVIINAYEYRSLFLYSNSKGFLWDDIVTDFVPFLIMLNNEFDINEISLNKGYGGGSKFDYYTLIDKDFSYDESIDSIIIYLK